MPYGGPRGTFGLQERGPPWISVESKHKAFCGSHPLTKYVMMSVIIKKFSTYGHLLTC